MDDFRSPFYRVVVRVIPRRLAGVSAFRQTNNISCVTRVIPPCQEPAFRQSTRGVVKRYGTFLDCVVAKSSGRFCSHHVEQLGDWHLWLLRRQGLRHRLLLQALLRAARASNRPIAAKKLSSRNQHSSPLPAPSFPMQCPSLTAGACVASRRRALHASGAPPWRRPASAAALVAAWASTAALPALFARCFGRIGEGTRPCEQMFSD